MPKRSGHAVVTTQVLTTRSLRRDIGSSYQYRKEGSHAQKDSVSVAVVIAILGYQNGSHCEGDDDDSRLARQTRHAYNDGCDRDDDTPCEGLRRKL